MGMSSHFLKMMHSSWLCAFFFFFFFLMFFHASNFDSYVLELRYEESGLILLSREVLMMTTRLQVHSYSCHVSEIKEKKG